MPYKKPTIKQKKAVEILVENGRKDNSDKPKTIGNILREAGYSEAIATVPAKVTGAAGFQLALQEAGVDDQRLARVIHEGLNATRPDNKSGNPIEDYAVRHKYLETSLRLKGFVKAEENGNTYNTFIQQNNLNPNAPDSKKLVDASLDFLMEQMKDK
jgi:hypothetical protein